LALQSSVFTAIGTTGNFAAAEGRFGRISLWSDPPAALGRSAPGEQEDP
jgi:hypothetical protein